LKIFFLKKDVILDIHLSKRKPLPFAGMNGLCAIRFYPNRLFLGFQGIPDYYVRGRAV